MAGKMVVQRNADDAGDHEGRGDDVVRLSVTVRGHTHLYIFPRHDKQKALSVIKQHAADGRLHPYVALMLLNLGATA
jgi:hypothetical protein